MLLNYAIFSFCTSSFLSDSALLQSSPVNSCLKSIYTIGLLLSSHFSLQRLLNAARCASLIVSPAFESLKWRPIPHFNLQFQSQISHIPWFSSRSAKRIVPQTQRLRYVGFCNDLSFLTISQIAQLFLTEPFNSYPWFWMLTVKSYSWCFWFLSFNFQISHET